MKKLGDDTHPNITQRLNQLDELSDSIIGILSIPLNNTKLYPVISKQQLFIYTDNTILATQIKYQQEKIYTHLNKIYTLKLKAVHTKLIPSKIASTSIKIPSPPLRESTSKILSSIADQIEDNELKQILKKISHQ